MTRDEALALLREHTQSENLRKHAYAVEAAMRAYARRFGADEELWGVTGLLHDFDYERWPEPPEHTQRGAEILRARGADERIVRAILSHAEWNAIPREAPLEKALFAVDELAGFVTAVAHVRPEGLDGMTPSSVKKKLKDKRFAAAVSREDIAAGAAALGVEMDAHVATVIAGMAREAKRLGFA